MEKRIISIVVLMVFISFVSGYLIGSFTIKLKVKEPVEVITNEKPDSFDGEYTVKLGMKELRLTEYDTPVKIGVIKIKGDVVSYNVNIRGIVKVGKSTYEIKEGSIFFDGVDIGAIVEHTKIKGDFTIDFNNNLKTHYITLEKIL